MEEIRYISKLADLTEILIEATNRYSERDAEEFDYIINNNEVNINWLARMEFKYSVIRDKIETEQQTFDLLPLKDDIPQKRPEFFETRKMVNATNKKYTALKTKWEKVYIQFHELVSSKMEMLGVLNSRIEVGGYTQKLYESLSAGLDAEHNAVADNIEELTIAYQDYKETLESYVYPLITDHKPAAAEPQTEVPEEETPETEPMVTVEPDEIQLKGSRALLVIGFFTIAVAIGGFIRLPSTIAYIEGELLTEVIMEVFVSSIILILLGINVIKYRNKVKCSKPLLFTGIAVAAWGAVAAAIEYSDRTFMLFADFLTFLVGAMILTGALMNINTKFTDEEVIEIIENEHEETSDEREQQIDISET